MVIASQATAICAITQPTIAKLICSSGDHGVMPRPSLLDLVASQVREIVSGCLCF